MAMPALIMAMVVNVYILYSIVSLFYLEHRMPYVNIRIAGTMSREQKAKIAAEITDTLERVAHKPKKYTYIAFDELPDENWAIAGQLLDEE
jgi:4-oxalocrotonate tautomerase